MLKKFIVLSFVQKKFKKYVDKKGKDAYNEHMNNCSYENGRQKYERG